MPITDEIKKTLSDPTPLYALAGAGELAYEKLREVPGRVEALTGDRKGAQELATATLHEVQTRLADAQSKVVGSVGALPTDLRSLQERAQTLALQQVGRAAELAVKAKEVYDELAERGKVVVEKGRPGGAAEAAGAPAEVVPLDEPVEAELVEEGAPAQSRRPARPRKASAAEKPAGEE
ncbi:hypothetical protein ACIGXM_02265 [Kitasatospora sp. NPDC052896]|uniref:hypothetical protein n=1 Tax=Kitasatospora sp. NPDC052896 TaxID=3364061 RepID=UPI0037CBBC14